MSKGTEASAARPDVYAHHDYRAFLRAWLDYLKAHRAGFSVRALARDAGVAPGYLPMITAGKRRLSESGARKLSPHLGLRRAEQDFLRLLVIFGNARSQSDRLLALTAMRRFPAYRRANPKEAEVHEYLTHWYYVAIREMTGLADFQLSAAWIRERLRYPVEESAVRKALEFLLDNAYIALDAVPLEERFVMGYTLPIRRRDLDKAKRVIEEAVTQLQTLADRARRADSVYHIEMALFPLTRGDGAAVPGKDQR